MPDSVRRSWLEPLTLAVVSRRGDVSGAVEGVALLPLAEERRFNECAAAMRGVCAPEGAVARLVAAAMAARRAPGFLPSPEEAAELDAALAEFSLVEEPS